MYILGFRVRAWWRNLTFQKSSRLVEKPFWGNGQRSVIIKLDCLNLPARSDHIQRQRQRSSNLSTSNQTLISSVTDPSSPNEGRQGAHVQRDTRRSAAIMWRYPYYWEICSIIQAEVRTNNVPKVTLPNDND